MKVKVVLLLELGLRLRDQVQVAIGLSDCAADVSFHARLTGKLAADAGRCTVNQGPDFDIGIRLVVEAALLVSAGLGEQALLEEVGDCLGRGCLAIGAVSFHLGYLLSLSSAHRLPDAHPGAEKQDDRERSSSCEQQPVFFRRTSSIDRSPTAALPRPAHP